MQFLCKLQSAIIEGSDIVAITNIYAMQTVSHDEILNEFIGKEGTPERTDYENELRVDVLAYRLKELRKRRKMTQTELAERLGIGKGRVSKIENGKLNLTLSTIQKIASALGAKISFDLHAQ